MNECWVVCFLRLTLSCTVLCGWVLCCDTGRHSWWTASHGSWFIELLCQELREAQVSGSVVDMEQVLTRTRFQVAYNQESSSDNRAVCGKKQMPSMYSTLTKQLHLPCLHWMSCHQRVLSFYDAECVAWFQCDSHGGCWTSSTMTLYSLTLTVHASVNCWCNSILISLSKHCESESHLRADCILLKITATRRTMQLLILYSW